MKVKYCKTCRSPFHYASFCPYKRKKPIPKESITSKAKRNKTANMWFRANKPSKGTWECYLQISALCPRRLTRELLTLEHVQAKVRAPELKYDITNIRPACTFCNKLKGSRSLEELAKLWPHLRV